jgi:hypothetical protein
MDHVMHQNDHLVNPYNFQKKKIIFVTMATIKLYIFDDFLYFLGFFLLPPQGFGVGTPDMGHVIRQNDHLVYMPYHIQKKSLKK